MEDLSEEFPLVLSTVREVGHYSCRSMTGNCRALAALADEPGFVQMNDQDAKELGIKKRTTWFGLLLLAVKLFLAQMSALVPTKALVI